VIFSKKESDFSYLLKGQYLRNGEVKYFDIEFINESRGIIGALRSITKALQKEEEPNILKRLLKRISRLI
jgi:hypothetical protein